jgi:DNA-binding NtrC family response regulator
MSLPAVTQLPQTDHLRIRALIKSLASGMIVPIELAKCAYRLGNESCHRAMDDLTESLPEEPLDLSEVERITINRALARCRGDKLQAARMLGIGKTTLYRKVAAYGIQPAHTLVCP